MKKYLILNPFYAPLKTPLIHIRFFADLAKPFKHVLRCLELALQKSYVDLRKTATPPKGSMKTLPLSPFISCHLYSKCNSPKVLYRPSQ
jgi:hypothetical protein